MDTRNFQLKHNHADADGDSCCKPAGVGLQPLPVPLRLPLQPSPQPSLQPSLQPPGSRRRRLWELGSHTHCPVVGVCLPMAALRRLADKLPGGGAQADDYTLHCTAVADCQRRTRLAEALQRELDRRFLLPLRQAQAAKSAETLAAWWQAQAAGKDLPGALWATLTHPRCDTVLENKVLAQVHMLQHQVGMASRVELARFEALIDENAVLTRTLAGAQRRCTQQAAAHDAQAELLRAGAMRLRGQLLARDSTIQALQQQADATPDLADRLALARDNAAQAARITALQRALLAARAQVERLQHAAAAAACAPVPRPPQPVKAAPGSQHGMPTPSTLPAADDADATPLHDRSVLCVGGRTASVPVYRRLVEDRGARFLHHDGGTEDKVNLLDHTLAAADLVICQAGCISHDAYWRVKDHCKRTGKRCVFVETPSATGLQRALAALSTPGSPGSPGSSPGASPLSAPPALRDTA